MDNFDFIFNPVNDIRKLVFTELISKVHGDIVLDLGCGAVGHYWSLGYIDKVGTVDFVDCNKVFIESQSATINQLSPEYLEANFKETILFLKKMALFHPS